MPSSHFVCNSVQQSSGLDPVCETILDKGDKLLLLACDQASKVDSTASAKQTQLGALAQRMADVDSGGVSLKGVKIG